ncbi:hypothetical protein [Marivita hallyeonensis]|uniref:Uncharacterized protein n=1 Tax=Marivita hallyeonensis TaxID=996342 RepID=A0A1M5XHK1_9RHOB|nr:hypothetical protein [Marivita hallyeonensis]SHH98723.1 hypothetical protein SAMN05443551_3928 [Marivita hallyeonensis]
MDRLSLILSLLSGAFITGTLVVTAFTLGFYNWWVIGGAAITGWVAAWPVAYLISRRIKARDRDWSPDRKPSDYAPMPKLGAKEV